MKYKTSVSIVVLAYNEEENIQKAITEIWNYLHDNFEKYEIILIDDGSKDKTAQLADTLAKQYSELKVYHNERNLGFGASEKKGFSFAQNELVSLYPADLQFDIKELWKLVELAEKGADVVISYRIKRRDPILRTINSKMYNLTASILFFITWYGDINSIKLFKNSFLRSIQITSNSAFVNTEIIIKANKKKCVIKEVGISHYPRIAGKQTGNNFKVIKRQVGDLFSYWFKWITGKVQL
ncbi:MAG: glycosyltransferase family 2 protein [Candidatus Nanoarchaeia archaeon]